MLGKYIGGGLTTIGLSGSALGTGVMFGMMLHAIGRNPKTQEKLFNLSLICFALIESFALFSLLICFLVLFS